MAQEAVDPYVSLAERILAGDESVANDVLAIEDADWRRTFIRMALRHGIAIDLGGDDDSGSDE